MSLSAAEPEYDTPRERLVPRLPTPVATYTLIAVNVLLFALEWYWSGGRGDIANATVYQMGANVGRFRLLVEPWRVLSSAFLHGSVMHIAMNMYALYILGAGLERLLGTPRVLAVYAASALGGGLFSALVNEQQLSVGASGAIWGLMTAEIAWLLRLGRRHGARVLPGGLSQITQPLVINVAISLLPGIDRYAHFGGGLAGAALALLFPLQLPADDRPWRPWAALGVLLMLASVVAAFVVGRPWMPMADFQ